MPKKKIPETPQPDVIAAALDYKKKGYAVTPVRPRDKAPRLKDWPNRILTEAEIRSEFRPGDNIGLLLGGPSGGLVDIDLDCPIARDLAPNFLPSTGLISSRNSAPGSHYYYVVTDEVPTREGFSDPVPDDSDEDDDSRKAMIVEIRGTGHQTIVPPSIHPSGEEIECESEGPPIRTSNAELRASVSYLAVTCLLVRHYPEDNTRHFAFLAFAGMLLRGGVSVGDVRYIVEQAARYVGDAEWEDRVRCVDDTAQKLSAGNAVTGGQTLSDFLDRKVIKCLRKWLNIEGGTTRLVDETNKNHAVVTVGGKAVILREYTDPVCGAPTVEYLRKPDFELLHCNRLVPVRGGKFVPLGRYWLNHPQRRQYDRIVFEPGIEIAGCYNLWRGFAVEPRKGDWSRFRRHLRKDICRDDERLFNYVLAWMADALQNPRHRPGVVVALQGKQGTGKGMLWREFGALFEPHYVHVTHQRHFTGHFNSLMEGCLFMFVDEAYWAGDKVNLGYVKSLITDPELIIERKGKDAFQLNNYIRIGISSNEDWVVPVELDDRRYCVIHVSDAHAEDRAYFKPIFEQMENGGREAMLFDLLDYDLSGVDLGDIPKTAARLEQQLRSADPIEQWWYHRLVEGYIIFHAPQYQSLNTGPDTGAKDPIVFGHLWPEKAPSDALHQEYRRYCQESGIRHPDSPTSFGMKFKKLCPSAKKIRMNSWYLQPNPDEDSKTRNFQYRPWGYAVPTLAQSRADFVAATGLAIDWEEEEPEKKAGRKRKPNKKS
jgi:hypothetical protein